MNQMNEMKANAMDAADQFFSERDEIVSHLHYSLDHSK
jgi:hypothetical protein